jgi:serine/threonine protein kinase
VEDPTPIDQRYELLDLIATGGEAHVYRARDLSTAEEVVLRLPDHPADSHSTQSAPAHHPGWVRLLATGRDPRRGFYQVFEYLRGEPLPRHIARGPLDLPGWLLFVRQSLDAISALHESGWIHDDLHAENWCQVKPDALSDWKLLELPFLSLRPPQKRSSIYGSIHTLAPEQLGGIAPNPSSNLYALGCLYYYAATTVYPHAGATAQEIAISRLRYPPEPFGEKARTFPASLSAWVMTLLDRDPLRRPPSVAAARGLLAGCI